MSNMQVAPNGAFAQHGQAASSEQVDPQMHAPRCLAKVNGNDNEDRDNGEMEPDADNGAGAGAYVDSALLTKRKRKPSHQDAEAAGTNGAPDGLGLNHTQVNGAYESDDGSSSEPEERRIPRRAPSCGGERAEDGLFRRKSKDDKVSQTRPLIMSVPFDGSIRSSV